MSWRVEIPSSTQRELDRLPEQAWRDAVDTIIEIGEDPFLEGSEELLGFRNYRRVYLCRSRYRMVYYVAEKQQRVVITRARLRGLAYVGLDRW